MPNHLIQNQLDFILFEEGSFSPLNWLLREGHLDYNDYLSWKKGTEKFLEDHFKTPITTLMTALEAAKDYAGLLKTVIHLRTRLQQNSPSLFIHYMRTHLREQ